MKSLDEKPRRRVVMVSRIEADSWEDLSAALQGLRTDIAMHGRISPSLVSGGYSSGCIIVTSEDGSIDHDSWAVDVDRFVKSLRDQKKATNQETKGEANAE